jgi:superfamily II DNA or RNA helicase
MIVDVGNVSTRVIQSTDAERSWISEYLAFEDNSARYRRANGMKDGRIRLFNGFSCSFPSGFLPLVLRASGEEGIVVQVLDKRTAPCAPDASADVAWLRDYQHAAVAKIEERARGILHMPTGSGKTEVAAALALRFPIPWLFLVHRTNLGDAAAERYERRTMLRAGRIGEGRWDVPEDATFVTATFQTIARGLDKKDPRVLQLLRHARGLLVDECHVLPASSFYRVVCAAENAYWRVGLSGTPLARGDRRSLLAVGALGPVVYRLPTTELVEAGVLAKPTIHMVEVRQQIDLPTFQGVYGAAVVRSRYRNAVVIDCVKRAERPCLVFVKEIAHGRALEKMMWKEGLRPAFVWGSASVDARNRHVRDLVSGRTDVLICSVIFQEGTDIPDLRSVVIASGGKSVIATLQRIGRGMRTAADKSTFEVWDVADRGCGCSGKEKHSGCRWLDQHTRSRTKAYAAEGHVIVQEQPLVLAPS